MRSFLQLLIALLTLAALIWAVSQGYSLLRTEQLGLDTNTQSVLILSAVILIVCTFVLNSAIRDNGQQMAQGLLLPRKLEVYESFLLVWNALHSESDRNLESTLEDKLDELRTCMTLQASRPVLQAMNDLLVTSKIDGSFAPGTQDAFDKLLLAMRYDLGQSSSLILKKDVHKLMSK